ncbi:MAG: Rieske 2Fe-2S domain-containing protein [Beijerinckiaceae bacterium]
MMPLTGTMVRQVGLYGKALAKRVIFRKLAATRKAKSLREAQMLSKEDNELLTRVGPGTPMGEFMRRYWIPAAFTEQVAAPDCDPFRVRLLCENLVLFRNTDGKLGLIEEACPHRLASLFYGRNEENGLRCVYHGLKFDIHGACTDAPCAPDSNATQRLKVKSYPVVEKGGVVWTYMGPLELMPEFPDLEWTLVPETHRFATRHIQECNWLQGLDGGFDASHLSFLHSGQVDLRKGRTDHDRRIVPSFYEVEPLDFGFACAGGRDLGDGNISWHVDVMLLPFHKIIPSVPKGAHVWAPIDDENTMLYSINFDPDEPLTPEKMEREFEWRGIHTLNEEHSEYAVARKSNDYLIDRQLQRSGKSFTGIRGLGVQDCAMQESMGPIADRTKENLLPCDAAIVKIRRLLIRCVRDHMAGKPLLGMDPASYRVRSARYTQANDIPFAETVGDKVRQHTKLAAE